MNRFSVGYSPNILFCFNGFNSAIVFGIDSIGIEI